MLGTGKQAYTRTPPERAAAVLAELARLSESKAEVNRAGGIPPLVCMLSVPSEDGQTHAAGALFHFSVTMDNKVAIGDAGGIQPLVNLLSSSSLVVQRHAAGTLWQLASRDGRKCLRECECGWAAVCRLRPEMTCGQRGACGMTHVCGDGDYGLNGFHSQSPR